MTAVGGPPPGAGFGRRLRKEDQRFVRGQGLAGDDGLYLRVGFGGEGVDGDDAGVRVRAPQHGPVQHAGQADVIDVVALAPDETGVFFAQHAPEANRVAGRAGRSLGRRHAGTSSRSVLGSEWEAAQRMARTMFS